MIIPIFDHFPNFSSALSEQNPCPKNRENDQKWVYTPSRSFSQFLGLIFSPETTLEKALNINDILNFSSALSEQNPCPKNRENDREGVYSIFIHNFSLNADFNSVPRT